MCSDATTDTAHEATHPGAAEPAPADLPPAVPSPAAPSPRGGDIGPLTEAAFAPAVDAGLAEAAFAPTVDAGLSEAAFAPTDSSPRDGALGPPTEAAFAPTADAGLSPPPLAPRTAVVGLGNPLLGDDGVGWRVVDLVRARLGERPPIVDGARPRLDLDCLAVGGLALMERLVGYERAILVDAVTTGIDPPGTVRVAPLGDVATRAASHLDSSHDAPLTTALEAGRSLGADLPTSVTVVTVEAACIDTFDERLTPEVAEAVWSAADAVLAELSRPVTRPE